MGKADAPIRSCRSWECPGNLREKMGSYNAEELTRRNDLGLLPEPRKVPRISRNEIIRTHSIGTFQEYVIPLRLVVDTLSALSQLGDQVEHPVHEPQGMRMPSRIWD